MDPLLQEAYDRFASFVGQHVSVSSEVLEGNEWREYGFTGWIATVSVGAAIIQMSVDYGMQFTVADLDGLMRNTKVDIVDAPHPPAWEIEPHMWEFRDNAWHRKHVPEGKTEECASCELFNEPGPVGYDGPENPEVLFVGEALGRDEVARRKPMIGWAGQVLRKSLDATELASISGITNIWHCRPPGNIAPATDPAEPCRDALYYDVVERGAKIIVPLGGTALDALTNYSMNITAVQGRLFRVNWKGHEIFLLPMYHPSFVRRRRMVWRDWELGFDKLKLFLDTGGSNYIPLSDRIVHQAKSRTQALEFIKRLRSSEFSVLSCDIETGSFNMPWENGFILTTAFAWSPTEACAIPWRFVYGEVFEEMKALLEDPSKTFLYYNGPYDVQFFWAEGIDAYIGGDMMLQAHLLDERNNVHSLKKDAGTWLDAPDWEEDLKRFKIPKNTEPSTQEMWKQIPEDELLEYNGQDVCHTTHLDQVFTRQFELEDGNLQYVYENILIPTTNMLARARRVGMRVDMYKVKELMDLFVPILDELTERTREITGRAFFNPNSPQDVLDALHKRGIKVPNTRRETLELHEGDEFVDAQMEYRQAQKMYSTYVVGIADDVYDDLKVHPDWREPAETGRLRCSDPNMLGMPRKTEEWEHKWKSLIKQEFIASSPDRMLAHIDQGQSEVRCACFLAQCDALLEVILRGRDLHGEMARSMYGDNYTHEQRVWAKMVTFGLIFNREAPSLARQLTAIDRDKARREGRTTYKKWTVREAQAIIDKFFAQMPRVLEWKKETMHEALTTQRLVSYFGRVRRFGLITWENKKHTENEAVNFPISCLSNDINLLNCIETMKRFGKYGLEILVPIHDAALIELPKKEYSVLDEVKALFEETPRQVLVGWKEVPFKAEVTVGERWSDL